MLNDMRLSIVECPEYGLGYYALKFEERFVAVGFKNKNDIIHIYSDIKLPKMDLLQDTIND